MPGREVLGLDSLRVRAMVRRQAYVQLRAPQRWFDLVVWPMVDTVIWGSIGLFVSQQGGAERAGLPYMLSGILLMHVMYQANVSMSCGFMEETWSRNLLNLMVSPLREGEFLAGLAIMSGLRLILGLSVVGVAAFALYSFNVTTAGWGVIPVVAVLMLVGWTIALFVMALVLRFGSGAEILCWGLLFGVVALSGAFYPIEAMPGLLQPIGHLLPSTHAFEAARRLLDGDPMPWGLIGGAAAGLVVALPVAGAVLLRMLRLLRARGYITRYS
jgi:ABC-2 type transport system permease protein